jgi:colanic acid biosynthesis glycosyl transferase WcaI
MKRGSMDVLILGHNYAPEPIGIGPCTAGLAEMLAANGHRVRVICGAPYYPDWKIAAGYRRYWAQRARENGVSVVRLPHYVPKVPRGVRRILHHLSFASLAFLFLLLALLNGRPSVMVAVVPSTGTAAMARIVAMIIRRPLWVHVQDLEIDMAIATGQLPTSGIRVRVARTVERLALGADRVSSISAAMSDRLAQKGVAHRPILELRNWARPDIAAQEHPPFFRSLWSLEQPYVALYSGNIAAKQGIEIVLEAARLLAHRGDIHFVVCGNGPNRPALVELASGCPAITFVDLQPADRLSDLLALATVHLLPQIADAADLVLPSKLPNMLASGRPVVATAQPGTALAQEVEGCGLVTPPHDVAAFASAIERLIDDAPLRTELGIAAQGRAVERWSMAAILAGFEQELRLLVAERQARRSWRRIPGRWSRQPLAE